MMQPGRQCGPGAAVTAVTVPVTVDGSVISPGQIRLEMQHHPAPSPLAAWTAAARALVVRELLLQEARRLKLDPDPSRDEAGRRETTEEALLRTLIEREVAVPEADADSCRRYHRRNLGRFRSADIYEASHILIAARPDQPAAFAAAAARAAALQARLTAAPEQFAELAVAHSDCPSAAAGGQLGQLTAGDTTPEFEQALRALVPGTMTRTPVATRYGFHIIRVDRHLPGSVLPFEAVHARIAGYLTERSRRTAIAQYIARLVASARISGIELPGPGDLRVS